MASNVSASPLLQPPPERRIRLTPPPPIRIGHENTKRQMPNIMRQCHRVPVARCVAISTETGNGVVEEVKHLARLVGGARGNGECASVGPRPSPARRILPAVFAYNYFRLDGKA